MLKPAPEEDCVTITINIRRCVGRKERSLADYKMGIHLENICLTCQKSKNYLTDESITKLRRLVCQSQWHFYLSITTQMWKHPAVMRNVR